MTRLCYTDEQIQFITELASDKKNSYTKIAELFNQKFNTNQAAWSIRHMAAKLGFLHKELFTQEEKDFVIDMITNQGMTYNETVILFNKKFNKNKTVKDLNSLGLNLGLKSPHANKMFTVEEKNFIVEMVVDNDMGYSDVSALFEDRFGRKISIDSLHHLGKRLGIKYVMHRKIHKKCERYDFYENQLPVGSIEKVRTHIGHGKHEYMDRIKIKEIPKGVITCSEKNKLVQNLEYWQPYHRYVYEQYYGVKLNPNQMVIHLDGDHLNNDITNLMCVNLGVIGYARANNFLDAYEDIRRMGFKLGKLNSILKNADKNE